MHPRAHAHARTHTLTHLRTHAGGHGLHAHTLHTLALSNSLTTHSSTHPPTHSPAQSCVALARASHRCSSLRPAKISRKVETSRGDTHQTNKAWDTMKTKEHRDQTHARQKSQVAETTKSHKIPRRGKHVLLKGLAAKSYL